MREHALRRWHGVFTLLVIALAASAPILAQDAPVRLAMVNVPDDVVRPLLPVFQEETGRTAEIVYRGNDPFSVARDGRADLVIAHYGHEGVKPFVTGGWGEWPQAVFANQMALLGPPADPAGVRGLADAAEALRRIAASQAPFLSNNSSGSKYLEQILWLRAGMEDKGDWYVDRGSQGPRAAADAAERGAYVLWGVPPFIRTQRGAKLALEPLVVRDPSLQRIMVGIVVNQDKVSGANAEGGRAMLEFLLAPATQARISAFRYPELPEQVWWPAGRHNNQHD